ncbi:hypothetical protein BC829DRAFT_407575 [Chytridium lagenaria]|nr:hypothetical protein BC829DRAFT_407575 [Chytridium lagenaria]
MSAEDIFHFATSSLSAFPEFSVSNFRSRWGGAKLRSAFLSSSPQRRQARSVQQRKRNQVSTALSFGKVQKHSLAVSPSTSPVKQGSLESTSSTGVLPKSTGFAFTFGDAATDTKSGLSFDILSNTLPSSSGVALFTFKGLDAGTDGANRDLALSAGLIDERRIVEEKETSSAS